MQFVSQDGAAAQLEDGAASASASSSGGKGKAAAEEEVADEDADTDEGGEEGPMPDTVWAVNEVLRVGVGVRLRLRLRVRLRVRLGVRLRVRLRVRVNEIRSTTQRLLPEPQIEPYL